MCDCTDHKDEIPVYDAQAIESKWMKAWEDSNLFAVDTDDSKPKKYVLEMFPYPSGDLHMGHARNYTIGDAMARQARMRGYDVLHPIGFDAFGLPAENAAIKHNTQAAAWTYKNMDQALATMKRMGFSYDLDRMVKTCSPDYYRWGQWIFEKLWEKGLVYRKKNPVNWCPTAGNSYYFRICFLDPFQGTVLANFAHDELGADTVYCLGQLGNDYDQGLMNYFKQAAEELGMTCIQESFPKNNSDFTSYMTTAKNEGADVIFAPTSISYAQLIVEQAYSQGVNVPLLGPDTWDSNMVLAAAQGKDMDVYVSTFYAEGGDTEFEAGFKEFINSDSDNLNNNGGNDIIAAVSAMGYDAYYVALEALKLAGSTDPAAVMAALPQVTYTGVTGDIAFDEQGDAIRDSAFIKQADTEKGAWKFVTVQTVAGVSSDETA